MTAGELRVAIVGAGIGGLTLALSLRARGVRAQVFERADALREVGAAVALAANGTRILTGLGLAGGLGPVAEEPSALLFRDGRDGREIARHDVGDRYRERFGSPFWGVQRAELQRVLADAWGSQDLHLSRTLQRIDVEHDDGPARLGFADRSSVTADVVVGADGLHSTLRRWVAPGAAPVYSGTSGFRGLVPTDRVPSLSEPGAVQFWLGPGAHLLHYRVGSLINFLAVVEGPAGWEHGSGMVDAASGALAAGLPGWHPAVREMIDAVPQSGRWGLFALPALLRWSRGPVVLLGDAAHAMLPHHGQGANQTIEDADVLAECLAGAGSGDIASAFARYERARRARTRLVQRSSWDTSALLHLPDGPATRERDARLRAFPERFAWVHGAGDRIEGHRTSMAGLREEPA